MDWITLAVDLAQVTIAGGGLALVFVQLRKNGNLSKIEMVMAINTRLAEYGDVVGHIRNLGSRSDWCGLPGETKERILDYISIFETVEVMHQMGALSVRDLEFYFAGRFSDLIESNGLKEGVFFDQEFSGQMRPVFSLHSSIQNHRRTGSNKMNAVPSTVSVFDAFENFDKAMYAKIVDKSY